MPRRKDGYREEDTHRMVHHNGRRHRGFRLRRQRQRHTRRRLRRAHVRNRRRALRLDLGRLRRHDHVRLLDRANVLGRDLRRA
jgi:hypothetical protein